MRPEITNLLAGIHPARLPVCTSPRTPDPTCSGRPFALHGGGRSPASAGPGPAGAAVPAVPGSIYRSRPAGGSHPGPHQKQTCRAIAAGTAVALRVASRARPVGSWPAAAASAERAWWGPVRDWVDARLRSNSGAAGGSSRLPPSSPARLSVAGQGRNIAFSVRSDTRCSAGTGWKWISSMRRTLDSRASFVAAAAVVGLSTPCCLRPRAGTSSNVTLVRVQRASRRPWRFRRR